MHGWNCFFGYKVLTTSKKTKLPGCNLRGATSSVMQRCEAELIVDASLPRSGTTALLNLLKTLGYETHQNLAKVIRLEEYRPALQLDGAGFNASASASLLSRFMRGGARKLAFGDIPMHVIACSLATRHANARFVLKTRDPNEWADSFAYMLCRWTRAEICASPKPNTNAVDFHAWAYGAPLLNTFCAQHASLCPLANSSSARLPPWASSLSPWRGSRRSGSLNTRFS